MARVLIVDDNFLENRSMKSALEVLGHVAVGVHTLKEGLDAAWDEDWQLILLDTALPDGDGVSAIPKFLEASDKAPLLLAVREEEDYPENLPILGVVRKPLKVKDFSESVAQALGIESTAVSPEPCPPPQEEVPEPAPAQELPDSLPPLKQFKEEQEQRYLERLLELTEHDVKKGMAMAGISRAGYYNLLKKHGLTGSGK